MSRASERRQSGGGGDEGGGANWMDTYGDLVTLLLTFFVLLFAFSTIDAEKWKSLVGSFGGANVTVITPLTPEMVFEKPIQPISSVSIDESSDISEQTSDGTAEIDQMLLDLYTTMLQYISDNDIDAGLTLIAEEYMIIMRFNDRVFFNSGDAAILPEAIPVLEHVVELFSQVDALYEKLTIEGHTDNVPINTARYPSNWELSVGRALSVHRYIMDTGRISPMRLKLGGYGEYDPIDTNDTPEGRALNRRVDFVVEGKRPQFQK